MKLVTAHTVQSEAYSGPIYRPYQNHQKTRYQKTFHDMSYWADYQKQIGNQTKNKHDYLYKRLFIDLSGQAYWPQCSLTSMHASHQNSGSSFAFQRVYGACSGMNQNSPFHIHNSFDRKQADAAVPSTGGSSPFGVLGTPCWLYDIERT